jgi:hypothetical protein
LDHASTDKYIAEHGDAMGTLLRNPPSLSIDTAAKAVDA